MKTNFIYILDDEKEQINILVEVVRQTGIESKSYSSAEMFFESLTTYEDNSILLLDLNMPMINGYEVLEFIQKHPKIDFPPVIVLSGTQKKVDIEACYELGANAYINKSFDIIEFKESMNKTFSFWGKFNITINCTLA